MKARPIQLLIGIVLIFIIAVGMLPAATSVNATPSAAALVPWTDDFSSASLNERWSWVREDPADWSLIARPGFLRITTQNTFSNINNLLVQDMPLGDYEIQTRVFFTPTQDFQFAGLLVYLDDANFLQLGRVYCGTTPPACVGNGIYFDRVEGGAFVGGNFGLTTAAQGEAYLKLSRHGNDYTGYVSPDGTSWTLLGTHTIAFTPTRIGLKASNQVQGASEIPADFDFFTLIDNTYRLFLPLVLNNPPVLPPPPVLVGPQDGAVLDTLIPRFQWDTSAQPAGTASCLMYSISPQATGCMSSGYSSSGPHERIAWNNLSPSTVYYWRVGAYYNGDLAHPNWSEEWSFTTGPAGGPILPAPNLISPADDSSVPPNNPVPTLSWNAVAGAVEYYILLHDIDGDSWYSHDTSATQVTLTWPALRPLAHYEWYVEARNDYAWGTSSATWQFTTTSGSAAHASSDFAADFILVKPDGTLVNGFRNK
jgi:hypothetical protein